MSQSNTVDNPGILRRNLLIGGAAVFAFSQMDLLRQFHEYHMIRMGLGLMIVACFMKVMAALLRMSASELGWYFANQASGLKGTASWGTWKILETLTSKRNGLFLGAYRKGPRGKRKACIVDFDSNAVLIGPSGSSKSTAVILNSLISIRHSKLVADFKSDLTAQMCAFLEARGETVYKLNLGHLFTDIVGETDYYNPLKLIADLFWIAGGLKDISEDAFELAMELIKEPAKGDDENRFFREGSRRLVICIMLFCVLRDGDDATLGDVALILDDPQELYSILQLICGELVQQGEGPPEQRKAPPLPIEDSPWVAENSADDVVKLIAWYRGLASGLLSQMSGHGKTFDSFLSGAQQSLMNFNQTTRVQDITSKSTFDWSELKDEDKVVTVFIMMDSTKMESQKDALSLLQFCAKKALKRHKNKHVPVYLFSDEASNFIQSGLISLLSWGRAYGLRHFLAFQNKQNFVDTYSEETFDAVISESEIIQFLPGQRCEKTRDLLVKLLGDASVMTAGYNGKQERHHDIGGHDLREDARAMLTFEESRRTPYAVTFIKDQNPFPLEPISIAEIDPWRSQITPSPFYGGKRYLKKIKLRMSAAFNRTFKKRGK